MTYGTLPPQRYPPISRLLHWSVAACVLATIPIAMWMHNAAAGALKDTLYNLHKSLGILILALMVVRLANRLIAGAPAPEPGIPSWQRVASSAVHGTLYLLLLVMPIVGWIANSAFGASTPFFGLFELPPLVSKNEALAKTLFALHRWAGFAVTALVVLHIGAALYHHFRRRDGVLQRMLPTALGGH